MPGSSVSDCHMCHLHSHCQEDLRRSNPLPHSPKRTRSAYQKFPPSGNHHQHYRSGFNSIHHDEGRVRRSNSSALSRLHENSYSHPGSLGRFRSNSFTGYEREISTIPEGTSYSYGRHLRQEGAARSILDGGSQSSNHLEMRSANLPRVSTTFQLQPPTIPETDLLDLTIPKSRFGASTIGQDNAHDYYVHLQQRRLKEDNRKRKFSLQTVMLIGCYALLVVVAVIVGVVVCYQNGWLGLGIPREIIVEGPQTVPLDSSANIKITNETIRPEDRRTRLKVIESGNKIQKSDIASVNNSGKDEKIRNNIKIAPTPRPVSLSESDRNILTKLADANGGHRIHLVQSLSQLEELRSRLLGNHARLDGQKEMNRSNGVVTEANVDALLNAEKKLIEDTAFGSSVPNTRTVGVPLDFPTDRDHTPLPSNKPVQTFVGSPNNQFGISHIGSQNIGKPGEKKNATITFHDETKGKQHKHFGQQMDEIVPVKNDTISTELMPNESLKVGKTLEDDSVRNILSSSLENSDDLSHLTAQELLDLLAIRRMRDLLNSRGNAERILDILRNIEPSGNLKQESVKEEAVQENFKPSNVRSGIGRSLDQSSRSKSNSVQFEDDKTISTAIGTKIEERVGIIRTEFSEEQNLSTISTPSDKQEQISSISSASSDKQESVSDISSAKGDKQEQLSHIPNAPNTEREQLSIISSAPNSEREQLSSISSASSDKRESVFNIVSTLSSKQDTSNVTRSDKTKTGSKMSLTSSDKQEQLSNSTSAPNEERDNLSNSLLILSDKQESVLNPRGKQESVLNPRDKQESVLNPRDKQESVLNPRDKQESVLNPRDKQESVLNPRDKQESVLNPRDKQEGVLNPRDKQESVLNPNGKQENISNIHVIHSDKQENLQSFSTSESNMREKVSNSSTSSNNQPKTLFTTTNTLGKDSKITTSANTKSEKVTIVSNTKPENLVNIPKAKMGHHAASMENETSLLGELKRNNFTTKNGIGVNSQKSPTRNFLLDVNSTVSSLINNAVNEAILRYLTTRLQDIETKHLKLAIPTNVDGVPVFQVSRKDIHLLGDLDSHTKVGVPLPLPVPALDKNRLSVQKLLELNRKTSRTKHNNDTLENNGSNHEERLTVAPSKTETLPKDVTSTVHKSRTSADIHNQSRDILSKQGVESRTLSSSATRTIRQEIPQPGFALHVQSDGGRPSSSQRKRPSTVTGNDRKLPAPRHESVTVQPGERGSSRKHPIVRSWTHKDSKGIFTRGQVRSDGSFTFTNCRPAEVCDENDDQPKFATKMTTSRSERRK